MIPDGRSLADARGKSELHRARVPGESQGDTCRCVSTVQIGAVVRDRESNRDDSPATGLKRAILPAAISDRAAIRLLAEARG
jgi:hypothetical protein